MPVNYPLHIDLFAIIILMGVVQGYFLAIFFLFTPKGNKIAHRYLGLFLFALSTCTVEVLLSYTNYMFKILAWVDFAEPLNFVLAPLTYLYLRTFISERFSWKQLLHFAPFVFYLVSMSIYIYPLPDTFKYNSYLDAYHPDLPFIKIEVVEWGWFCKIRDHVNDFMFVQMVIYVVVGFIELKKQFQKVGLSIFSKENSSLSWCRTQWLSFASIVLLFLIVKRTFPSDLGDHILSAHITFIIYAISFSVIRQSDFFKLGEEAKPIKKYEKSTLTEEIQDQTLERLEVLMRKEKLFLREDFSLPFLAKKLGVSPHHLSQILNESLGQSFFDYAAQWRIVEAQRLLVSLENQHIKIEEIAEMVGYNSKSAFNTAFKKIVGQTPSQYRKEEK
ncbi:helix-turn-helix domain-containing protein [Flectobacillus rivi]|uniref:Helix-turn-helix transcriptional regulator n=1 Tax=Flectobacillus rivi TaxID=2984209 RepID=A0ABT6Z1Z3_9BACT|nr:helix-turn-helix transcriptional regulator [Flectobacillus rivi]MDI9875151.1 helix-turn-helix transcriptional regulator [Flectobacillus rivi]